MLPYSSDQLTASPLRATVIDGPVPPFRRADVVAGAAGVDDAGVDGRKRAEELAVDLCGVESRAVSASRISVMNCVGPQR